MFDLEPLLGRYAQLRGHEADVKLIFDELLDLRRAILDLESVDFDDPTTQGQRYYVGYVRLAQRDDRPNGLDLVDETRGVLSIFGLPFKVYRPNPRGAPGSNKTRVADAERASLAYQTRLFTDEQLRPGEVNMLLRVVVDADGDPLLLVWEEWDGRCRTWSADVYRQQDGGTPIVSTAPAQPPPPVRPVRDPVTVPGDLEENDPDDNDPS